MMKRSLSCSSSSFIVSMFAITNRNCFYMPCDNTCNGFRCHRRRQNAEAKVAELQSALHKAQSESEALKAGAAPDQRAEVQKLQAVVALKEQEALKHAEDLRRITGPSAAIDCNNEAEQSTMLSLFLLPEYGISSARLLLQQ